MTLDRATVLAGIPDALGRFEDLVRPLSAAQLAMPTRCDGWTVAHVAGHVVGTVVDVAAGRLEGQGTPEVTARQAHERAERSGPALADELAGAAPSLLALFESLPAELWTGPAPSDPRYTLGFAVEAMWFDAYLHGEDIRSALGLDADRGPGLRCAVHHVAGYLDARGAPGRTLALDGIEPVEISGGGPTIAGDPYEFVLAATGRRDPTPLGLDASVNVYSS